MEILRQFRSCWAEIDLNAIEHNIREIKNLLGPKAKLAAIIKADAYGHGSIRIAQSAILSGADILAVSALDEALELRQADINAPILILGYSESSYAPYLVEYDISQTIYNYQMAKDLSDAAVNQNKIARIHLKIDSGMGRIGFLPTEESFQEILSILRLPNLYLEGLFTHFASADESDRTYTHKQYEKFKAFSDRLLNLGYQPKYIHCANSATIIEYPDYHLDLVRAGIILYGVYPSNEVKRNKLNLRPAMSVKTKINNIKLLPKDESISYGRQYITKKETKVATISIGYADGYPRKLSNKARVIVNGEFAEVIGTICMDQCMIDVTHIKNIAIGDEVVVFGRQKNKTIPVEEIANNLGTVSYEVLCDIGRRLPRIYVRNGEVESVVNYLLNDEKELKTYL